MGTKRGTFRTGARRMAMATALAAAIGAAACSPVTSSHGYVPTDAELATISVGRDDRDSVVSRLGPPTTRGVPGNPDFYYVASEFERRAFLAPRETSRQVVAVSFDAAGRVANVERFALSDGRVVPLSRRVTDTTVADNTFLRQILTNFGRVDAATLFGDGGGTP